MTETASTRQIRYRLYHIRICYFESLSLEQIDVVVSEKKLPGEFLEDCDQHGIEYVY